MLRDRINHLVFSNRFYRAFLKPLDRLLSELTQTASLQRERAAGTVPVNKLAQTADLENPEWAEILDDMSGIFHMDSNSFHRKHWEFVQLAYMLKHAGFLHPGSSGLAVGAGREPVVYYLTHKVKKVIGIDLYAGSFMGGEDEPDIPDHPAKYAPFVCSPGAPDLRRMDALELDFPDHSFDFVFSASSIEHFGKEKQIRQSVTEMYRVLKPGGVAAITTELGLNRLARSIPNTRIFRLAQLLRICINAGFRIDTEGIDLRLEDQFALDPVKLPEEVLRRPHVILRYFSTLFTSLSLLLRKPGEEAIKGDWQGPTDFTPLDYRGQVAARAHSRDVERGSALPLTIDLKNTGNFDWFVNGSSHRIAVGIQLCDRGDGLIDRDFHQFQIPRHLPRNDSLSFSGSIPICMAPGEYRLKVTLKREFITWFPEETCPSAVIDFSVS